VLSALLLAAVETGIPDLSRLRRVDNPPRPALPSEPTGAAVKRQAGPTQTSVSLPGESRDITLR
jgi:hypothetical protein